MESFNLYENFVNFALTCAMLWCAYDSHEKLSNILCDMTNYRYSKIILAQSLNCGKRTHARKNVNFSYL